MEYVEYNFCYFTVFPLHVASLNYKTGFQPVLHKSTPQPKSFYWAYDVTLYCLQYHQHFMAGENTQKIIQ